MQCTLASQKLYINDMYLNRHEISFWDLVLPLWRQSMVKPSHTTLVVYMYHSVVKPIKII